MTACPGDEELAAHLAGALAPEVEGELRAHLDSCESCREILTVLVRGTPGGTATDADAAGLPARYRVDRVLGEGGMGRVYAAHDRELSRDVAVKVMRPERGSPEIAVRMLRESRLMARVSHPAVVTVYDVGRVGDAVYVAMELVAGGTLAAWARAAPRSWRDVVDVYRRAGEGLAAAHAAGLVHRDVKPDNILVAADRGAVARVAVSDFGVARALAGDEAAGEAAMAAGTPPAGTVTDTGLAEPLTRTGMAVGTPAYMAPEQLDGGRVDARADVFAFAVSMWETLYGARPYPGQSLAAIRAAQASGPPAVPRAPSAGGVRGDVPAFVGRALSRALAADPEARTPTMTALLAAIDPRPRARRWQIAGGVAVLGVAAAAIALATRGRAAPRPATCTDAGLATVWTPAAQAGLRAALADLEPGLAKSIGDRAVAGAESWATTWTETRRAACASTDRGPAFVSAAAACLAAQRRAFGNVLTAAPGLPRADRVELDRVVGAITSPRLCATDAAVLLYRDATTSARRANVDLALARLSEAASVVATGDVKAGAAAFDALAATVDAAASPALTAQYLLGRARAHAHDPDAGIDLYRQAAVAGDKSGRDDVSAEAWTALAWQYVDGKSDPARADEALQFADAAIVRAGEDPRIRVVFLLAKARVRAFEGALDEARGLLDQALARAPTDAPDVVDDLQAQRVGLMRQDNRLADALALAKDVLADRVARYGANHYTVGRAHALVSDIALTMGDLPSAVAASEAAATVAETNFGTDGDDTAMAWLNLSEAYGAAGRYDDALAQIRKARPVLIATRGELSFMVARSYESEGMTLARAGKVDDGVAALRRSVDLYERSVGLDNPQAATATMNFATTLVDIGKADEGLPLARKATAAFRRIYGDDNAYTGFARGELGRILFSTGQNDEAIGELEAAVAIYDKRPLDPGIEAGARFNLATALVKAHRDHARAIALAKRALEDMKVMGGEYAYAVPHIEEWLRAYGP